MGKIGTGPNLTHLRDELEYDVNTGIFTWKVSTGSASPGKEAGCINGRGYIIINVRTVLHLAHRLAWMYISGEWPDKYVDHINGNRSDNRFINLRLADFNQNCMNKKRTKKNKSGVKGVSPCKQTGRWRASIQVNGIEKMLGRFETIEEAAAAYKKAALAAFGEFANYDR